MASANDLNANVRSYRMTTIGATTIVSLHAIPSAHAATDAHNHAGRSRWSGARVPPTAARCAQYTVSRRNVAIINSVRCDT